MSKTKLITAPQLRKKKTTELLSLLKEKQKQIILDRISLATQKSKNSNLLKSNRVQIARIKTVLSEKRELAKLKVSEK